MAAAKNKTARVRHAGIFWVEGDPAIQRYAVRGDEVTLPAEEYDRLAKFDAFETAESPMEIEEFPMMGDLPSQVAWLDLHSLPQVLDAARANQSAIPMILAAEEARPQPRAELVGVLRTHLSR